jgi:hypothetical protein
VRSGTMSEGTDAQAAQRLSDRTVNEPARSVSSDCAGSSIGAAEQTMSLVNDFLG